MDYTDGLVEFPIRVYDRASSIRAMKQEDMGISVNDESSYAIGIASIPLDEFKGVVDYIPKDRLVEDIERDGWECCVVITNTMGEYLCNIPRIEFKDNINKFASSYLEKVEKMVEDNFNEKEKSTPIKKKRSFFTSWR